MDAHVVKVGMREFREHLPHYLLSSSPVAITRHGETMGFYIPAHHHPEHKELQALKQAALALDKLLTSHNIAEEELLAEFRSVRKRKKQQ